MSELDNVVAAGYEYVRRANGDLLARQTNAPLFQARQTCGADMGCIRERQIDAIRTYHDLGASVSSSEWDHNGSKMRLVRNGSSRKFFYETPRAEMLSVGARPGALLFAGEAIDQQYIGTALIFGSNCGQIPYQVSGPILDEYDKVVLQGQVPRIDGGCHLVGYRADTLEFTLLKPQGTASAPPPSQPSTPPQPPPEPSGLGTARTQLSEDEVNALRTRISQCWSPPAGVDARSNLYVVLRVLLNPDGSIARDPVVVEAPAGVLGPAMTESAKRAVLVCQPFTMLSSAHYDLWKDMELKFDPSELLGDPKRAEVSPPVLQSPNVAQPTPAPQQPLAPPDAPPQQRPSTAQLPNLSPPPSRTTAKAPKAAEDERTEKIIIGLTVAAFLGLLISVWILFMVQAKRNKKFVSDLSTSRRS